MKTTITCLICLLTSIRCLAQLHDNTWVLGYPGFADIFGHSVLTFTEGSLQIDSNSLMHDIFFPQNNSAYSDEQGGLFAFFNGMDIRNKTFVQDVENGGEMDEGVDLSTDYYLSLNSIPQGSIFIPYPGHRDSVILLYTSNRYLSNASGGLIDRVSFDVLAAIINTSENNNLGKVMERKWGVITEDTIQLGQIKTVKHANGRDWWCMVPTWNSRAYYRILIDPAGIHNLGIELTDIPITHGSGGSVYSPDGSKYIMYNAISADLGSYLYIFDFDRCTGLLSNQVEIKGIVRTGGVAVSPNSRFLYNNKSDTAFQYDLQAADIAASRLVIAVYDGYTDPFPGWFYMMQLAPDGKIYTSASNGTRYLHVIHRPDEAGTNCQFQQHGIQLYKYNSFTVPNFPNYRLGPLDGSPCDTLGLNNVPVAWYRYDRDTLDPLRVAFTDLSYYEPATWSWDFGDGSAGSTERHPEHQFPQADAYTVCLTVSNAYGTDTHCKTLYLGVSAQDNPVLQAQVQVWPNAFRDWLAVGLSANLRSPVFRLYDMMGRAVRQTPIVVGVNEIGTSDLSPGIYFWEILSGGMRVKQGKLLKGVE